MCGYFVTGFIEFGFKSMIGTVKLFSPNNFEKNEKVILNHVLKQNISMKGLNACDTEQLDNSLQFRLSRIKEIQVFSLQKS